MFFDCKGKIFGAAKSGNEHNVNLKKHFVVH